MSEVSADEIVTRDAKRTRSAAGTTICIAQIEVVGKALLDRKDELLEAMRRERENKELALYALMVTDVLEQGNRAARRGRRRRASRAASASKPHDSTIELPGVMSRKKEVAPKLLTAL